MSPLSFDRPPVTQAEGKVTIAIFLTLFFITSGVAWTLIAIDAYKNWRKRPQDLESGGSPSDRTIELENVDDNREEVAFPSAPSTPTTYRSVIADKDLGLVSTTVRTYGDM